MPTTTDDFDDDYVFVGWDFLRNEDVREYYARRRARLNPRRATPFVHDIQVRSVFITAQTGDWRL